MSDLVKPMIQRRKDLGFTQEDLDNKLGVADRLVSKWECGSRTPTSFHLYCWADVLDGAICFIPKSQIPLLKTQQKIYCASNDNNVDSIGNKKAA